ncbi:MAG: FAD:protein FMN transferase [Actinomycetota bacterium]|nr:FAD:protein FMN transferase [Actinomycetota bacterium]
MPSLDVSPKRAPGPSPSRNGSRLAIRTDRAMASIITVQVRERLRRRGGPDPVDGGAVDRALREFHLVEKHCSRFDRDSALSHVNRHPGSWHRVPRVLHRALDQAARAHRQTSGLFDPRVLDRLIALGYDRSFHLIAPPDRTEAEGAPLPELGPADRVGPWQPRLIPRLQLVHLGGVPVDLGGIGKSLALRQAAAALRESTADFLIDAGGDLFAAGRPAPGARWRVAVESPSGLETPVAVLEISDMAVATSSIRVRKWMSDRRLVHHLVDPRTGQPGRGGLEAVTVAHTDPVQAEVWAKSLFLTGRDGVGGRATEQGLAALWIDRTGSVGMTPAMAALVIWALP